MTDQLRKLINDRHDILRKMREVDTRKVAALQSICNTSLTRKALAANVELAVAHALEWADLDRQQDMLLHEIGEIQGQHAARANRLCAEELEARRSRHRLRDTVEQLDRADALVAEAPK